MAVALVPPLMTGVSCCHVEFVLFCGWTAELALTGACVGCWDAIGGGELTGVDGFELKLLMLWSVDVNIVCIALPTIVSFCIAGLCCVCGWFGCEWCAVSCWLYNTGEWGVFGPAAWDAEPRNVLIGGSVWLCCRAKETGSGKWGSRWPTMDAGGLPVSVHRVSRPAIESSGRALGPGAASGRAGGRTTRTAGRRRSMGTSTSCRSPNRRMVRIDRERHRPSVMRNVCYLLDCHEGTLPIRTEMQSKDEPKSIFLLHPIESVSA